MKVQGVQQVRKVLKVLVLMVPRVLVVLTVLTVLLPVRPALARSRRSGEGAEADAAQSPNNAGIVVVVADQSGLVVKDAKVTVVNNQTGAAREANSGADGSASFPALSSRRPICASARTPASVP